MKLSVSSYILATLLSSTSFAEAERAEHVEDVGTKDLNRVLGDVGCADSTDLMYGDNTFHDCDWVAKKPTRRCVNDWLGVTLADFCPVSCDNCDSITTILPVTAAPTTVPVTAAPTQGCYTGDEWLDSSDYGCTWYEENEEPGCPNWGYFPGADGVSTAAPACCHCEAPCYRGQGWKDQADFGCEWYETFEKAGCPIYSDYPGKDGASTAGSACCHCQCEDLEWVDDEGYDCSWYQMNDELGCPEWGYYPSNDGTMASEACCHCGGGNSESPK